LSSVRLTVEAAGDALREQRLTRQLCDHLRQFDELEVDFEPPVAGPAGAKGTTETLALLVAAGSVARAAGPVLVAALDSWFERNKHNRVVVERPGTRIELTGQADAHQLRLLERALGGEEGGDRGDPDVQ